MEADSRVWQCVQCSCEIRESFYLLFAAVDLPFLLCGKSKHGFPVLLCEVKLILQSREEEVERAKGRGKNESVVTGQGSIRCMTTGHHSQHGVERI